MSLFKKRKKESVAIPFLISMIVTLFVVGVPVLNFYNYLINEKDGKNADAVQQAFVPTEKNSMTLLFTFDPDDASLRDSFMLVRTSALDKSFTFIPVSNDILCDDRKMSQIFKDGGIIELEKAIEKTFDISVDKYMSLNNASLALICDSLGGVNYPVPDGLKGLNEGTQFLDSNFVIKLISNPKFAEDARTVTTGSVFAEMLAGVSGSRVADIVDYTYNQLVNMTETDITSIDYQNQKEAIDYILRSGKFKSTFRVPSGENTKQGIVMDKSAIKTLKEDAGL
ncbi:MAG: hypothetical protein E7505_03455 [Ruminococcus sp.]|nr:hypothetical protein [Ruminococcus sp.]